MLRFPEARFDIRFHDHRQPAREQRRPAGKKHNRPKHQAPQRKRKSLDKGRIFGSNNRDCGGFSATPGSFARPFHERRTPGLFYPGETKRRDPHPELGQAGGRPVGPSVHDHDSKQTLNIPYPSGPDVHIARTRSLPTWLPELSDRALGVVFQRPSDSPRTFVRVPSWSSHPCFQDSETSQPTQYTGGTAPEVGRSPYAEICSHR